MRVIGRQRNSRRCFICGLDNEQGARAPFYNLENGTVASLFRFREFHQSYPGRVHGGVITAMLDEMGIRAVWAAKGEADGVFGVTMSLNTKYRRPVPYETELLAAGKLVRESSKFFVVDAIITDPDGTLLASGTLNYLKMTPAAIAGVHNVHEEMPYLIADGRTELDIGEW